MFVVNVLADGEGRSKKKAKQAAAEAFIYLLIYKVIKSPPESPQNDHDFTSKLEVFENLDKTIEQGNFIGALQEFCFRWGLSKPSYRFEMEIGESKAKLFFVSCELPKLGEAIRTFGSSGKKKAAKQIAAEEMWHKVHNEMDETSRA